MSVFKQKCEGKTECGFKVEDKTFGGDPCRGTFKYAEVDYKCLPTGELEGKGGQIISENYFINFIN